MLFYSVYKQLAYSYIQRTILKLHALQPSCIDYPLSCIDF